MKGLSPRQKLVLEILENAVRDGERLTVREIGDHIGVSSTCTVHQHLKALERKGYLKPTNHKHRSIELTAPPRPFISVPFRGAASAGAPSEAEAPANATLLLPTDLMGEGEAEMYQVRGDSMGSAAIRDGDLVVVRLGEKPDTGDVVVATAGGDTIIKRLTVQGDRAALQAGDPDVAPLPIDGEVSILGRVCLVVRRL